MDYFKSKLSQGLTKLVSAKNVKHFDIPQDNFLVHSESRKNYQRQFNEALISELSEARPWQSSQKERDFTTKKRSCDNISAFLLIRDSLTLFHG